MTSSPSSSTRPLVRKVTGSKIDDYFEKKSPAPVPSISSTAPSQQPSENSVSLFGRSSSPPLAASSSASTSQTNGVTSASTSPDTDAPEDTEVGDTRQESSKLQKTRTQSKKRVKHCVEEASQFKQRKPPKRAKLAILPSLPLDIFFETFKHLMPLDLLQLSRTTKALRRLLLQRSSTSLWKDCLAQVPELPPFPEDMSLPSLVSLAFDTHCNNCGTRNASKCVDFVLRLRYCGKCVKSELSSHKKYDNDDKMDAIILRAVPFSDFEGWGERFCSKAARDAFLEELSKCEGDRTGFINSRCERNKSYADNAALWKKWYSAQVDNREENLRATRIARKEYILEKFKSLGYDKEVEYLAHFESRYPYGCAITPNPDITLLRNHQLVKPAKKLTEKTWATIEPEMLQYVKNIREYRIQDARCLILRARRSRACQAYTTMRMFPKIAKSFPPNSFMPGVADFLEFPDVKALIEQPGDAALALKDFTPVLQRFGILVAKFRVNIFMELWQLTRGTSVHVSPAGVGSYLYQKPNDSMDVFGKLDLAIIVFRCIHLDHFEFDKRWLLDEGIVLPAQPCDMSSPHLREPCMWYPEFLHHPCCTMMRRKWFERHAEEYAYFMIDRMHRDFRRVAWDVEKTLAFDEKASKAVRNLLTACAMDPETTTVANLDRIDHRFVCLKCTFGHRCDGERRVRVWSWRDAVQHSLKTHFGDAQVKWECISPEDTVKARQIEATEGNIRGYRKPDQKKRWKCVACRDTVFEGGRMTWQELTTHFTQNPKHGDHNAMEQKKNENYYEAEGYIARERPPVHMIPIQVGE